MSDTEHNGQDITGPDTLEPLSAVQAAELAGVNEKTIRRAIAAGKLPAFKVRGAYRIAPSDLTIWKMEYDAEIQVVTRHVETADGVALDTEPDRATDKMPSPSGQSSEGEQVAELWRLLEDEHRQTVSAKDETISRLDSEVVYLREQLAERSKELAAERERSDVLQQLALQRIEALMSGLQDDESENEATESPETALGGAGATEPHHEDDPSSWLSVAWRRLRKSER